MVDPPAPSAPSPSSRIPHDTELGGMHGEELRDSAGVAARALHDDPLFAHLAPDVRLRRRGMPVYFRANLGATARVGATTVARRHGSVVPKNLAWYRRFGFEIEQELRVGAANPAIRTMRRPVRD
jgi:hypothetical protein